MSNTKLKYPQKVHAKITRIYDQANNEYHLMRNDTKIIFGNGDKLLGSVIMTNPGSFSFKNNVNWQNFVNGIGPNVLEDENRPDPTMINIIKAIEESYKEKGSRTPDGCARIYNLSSIICPDGEQAMKKHNRVKQLLDNKDVSPLEDPAIYNRIKFYEICNQSQFVIMGFLKNVLTEEAYRLIEWIDSDNKNKKVIAPDLKGFPYHPIVWIKIKGGNPFKEIVGNLSKII